MALCSQVFNSSTKRSCNFNPNPTTSSDLNPAKRICLSNLKQSNLIKSSPFKLSTHSTTNNVCLSSSESDDDSDDEQSCYKADQVKAKRRASTRVSFSLNLNSNSELSKAISKYSDDDDYESDLKSKNDDNSDCKLSSSPYSSSTILMDKSNLNSNSNVNHQSNNIHQSLSGGNNSNKKYFQISDNSSHQCLRKSIPESDKQSRSRCFEYLVGSIDEAWARYCDATTYVEDEVYGYNTPASIATDDEDYFGNTTDLTDYESDYNDSKSHQQSHQPSHQSRPTPQKPQRGLYTPIDPNSGYSTPNDNGSCKDPSSSQLQILKDRLTKAKYFLQDLVDSDDFNDANAFWKRWDMIKYATIELVEDDDDDEIIESTIDELEDGRLFSN